MEIGRKKVRLYHPSCKGNSILQCRSVKDLLILLKLMIQTRLNEVKNQVLPGLWTCRDRIRKNLSLGSQKASLATT